MSANLVGRWSASALFLIGVAYIVTLATWFMSHGVSEPIVGPVLVTMEILTLLSAPIVVVTLAAVHEYVQRERKIYSLIALAFGAVFAGMTSAVHFVGLTALHQLGSAGIVWPSVGYAVELLAWDVFLGLALLSAGLAFERSGHDRGVRRALLACGALCLAGVIGPAVGNLRIQLIGILGYAGVLPVVCFMLARLFREAH